MESWLPSSNIPESPISNMPQCVTISHPLPLLPSFYIMSPVSASTAWSPGNPFVMQQTGGKGGKQIPHLSLN
jgi:hypothetical protein